MPGTILSYRDLVVWQKAMNLTDLVYRITDKFPRPERFGLALQMRKAAVMIHRARQATRSLKRRRLSPTDAPISIAAR
ncbi:MAG: hypothetical protein DMG04_23555 [Acidobacteria bacterium]|nr:MAG: hypothetical protein DMG04_23555 [Acidobacteriota bacterium]PYQ83158.1 MAG: hypothetical protein DMG03_14860 [Acidobacteriota bacterium]PYQ85609.1 MAG: hypothetical protein DMG02_27590 [Acidobacteriota bacterium]